MIAAAAKNHLPAIYPYRYFAADGGLMSYGPDTIEQYRRAAGYVDRILKGEKPADLPVQAPTKYNLVINHKAAKARYHSCRCRSYRMTKYRQQARADSARYPSRL